jgi:hypothetical protein
MDTEQNVLILTIWVETKRMGIIGEECHLFDRLIVTP